MKEMICPVGHSHIDLSWLWPRSETIHEICPRTFNAVLRLMERYPFIRFVQSSAQIYEWMEKYYPDTFEFIGRKIEGNQWEIVGGSWVEHNATIPCGESLVRQHLYGKRYFMEKFGVDVKAAWLPDTFSFAWSLPQIYKKCGINYFLTFKLKWQVERMKPPMPFPYFLFWWQSADGSKVLAHHTVGSYNEKLDQRYSDMVMLGQLEELKKTHGINRLLVLYGFGDHGGGPTEAMIRKLQELEERKGYPQICFEKAEQYFEGIRSVADEKELPTVNDELYVKTHRGTLTTEAMMKWENRRCEVLLLSAERFLCVAKRYGFAYPKRKLEKNWKRLLFNQVHDNLDGTSIEAVYQDAATDYRDIRRFISKAGHLEAIAKHIDTLGREKKALVVFNPLAWGRKSIAEVSLSKIGEKGFRILDQKGAEVPYQIVEDGEKKVIFAAEAPAMGYSVYQLVPAEGEPIFETDLKTGEDTLENAYLRVQADPQFNYAVGVFDKQAGKTVFDPKKNGNILEIYEDKPPRAPDGEPAWNIYLGYKSEPPATEVCVIESGPVRGKIRIKRRFGDSTFIQDIVLYAGAGQVDFEISIDWHENYRFAKTAFPLSFSAQCATYEIPYGAIQRYDHSLKEAPADGLQLPQRGWEMADMARWEASAQQWVDVTSSSGDYGASLLNDCKYGFSFEDNTLRMSLVRGPRRGYRSTPDSWADQSDMPRVGTHHIRYAVYPHRGDWKTAGTVKRGYEFNYPLQVIVEEPHEGELPPQHSFIEVSPENIILAALKEAEDSEDLVIRMYEAHGLSTEAKIEFDLSPKKAQQTDLMEWDKYMPKTTYAIRGKSLSVPMGAWEIKTIRLHY